MRSGLAVFAVLTIAFLPAFAQTPPQQRESTERGDVGRDKVESEDIEIPLPMVSPRAVEPQEIHPLTPKEKALFALRNTVGARAIANRAILAGLDHSRRRPEGWSGDLDGFGARFGSRAGALAVRNSIELGADVVFRTEPRYDICQCSGFWARTAHAWRRSLVARKDSGGETIAISRIAGAYATPFVTHTWYPDRYDTVGSKLASGTQTLAFQGLTNMVREFWPDWARAMRLPRPFRALGRDSNNSVTSPSGAR